MSVHNVKAMLTATGVVHRNSIGFLFIESSSSTNTLFVVVVVVLSWKESECCNEGRCISSVRYARSQVSEWIILGGQAVIYIVRNKDKRSAVCFFVTWFPVNIKGHPVNYTVYAEIQKHWASLLWLLWLKAQWLKQYASFEERQSAAGMVLVWWPV